MKLLCLLLLAVCLEVQAEVHLNYTEVKKLGNSCPHLDSCGHQRSSGSRELYSIKERNCACDYLCHEYGDCCIDAPGIQVRNALTDYKCYELKQFGGVYMIDSCLVDYEGPDDVRYQCEATDPEDLSDPLGVMPVTDHVTGITYKNYYCSICNYKTDNVVMWTPRLECPTVTLFDSAKNISQEYVFNNIASSGNSWGLYLAGENGSLFFHDCEVDPVMPALLESKIRLCKTELISGCPNDWEDDDTRTLCTSYMGTRFIHGGDKYRNAHCAICNGVNTTHLSCKSPEMREMTFFRQFETHAFALLLDINGARGNDVGMIRFCNNDEIFDPFFKICRSLTCLPGYMKQNNECVPKGYPVEDFTYPSGSGEIPPSVEPDLVEINSSDNLLHTKLKYQPVPENLENEVQDFNNVTATLYNESDIEVNVTVTSYNESDIEVTNPPSELENCLLISLTAEDYIKLPDDNIFVPRYNKTYEPSSYHVIDGSIFVCSHLIDVIHYKFEPYMGLISAVAIISSIICLIAHITIFFVVPDLQNLPGRDLVSHCIALLFAYTSFLTGSFNDVMCYEVCTAVSFSTFYFFQVTFFWMAVMSFDVWRTLRKATIELRVTKGKQTNRFLCYSFIAWVMPLILTICVALAEFTDAFPAEFRPKFASPSCWFRNRYALLVFFVSPLAVIIFVNILFFGDSIRMLRNARKCNLKQHTTEPRKNFKLYLKLTILMGILWTVGFLAGFTENSALWIAFILLNACQGILIFCSFSCTRKVKEYFAEKYFKHDLKSTRHSNSTGSTNVTLTPTTSKKFSSKFLLRNKNSINSNGSGGSIRKLPPAVA